MNSEQVLDDMKCLVTGRIRGGGKGDGLKCQGTVNFCFFVNFLQCLKIDSLLRGYIMTCRKHM